METSGILLGLLGIIGFLAGIIWLVVTLLRRRDVRRPAIVAGIALGLLILGVVLTPNGDNPPTPAPTNTPIPTQTVAPAPTTQTVAPAPTDTPIPTQTVAPAPTDTPIPTPTVAPAPTDTPIPTQTVAPAATNTPVPTATFDELRRQALTLSYDDLFRNNEQHKGKTVTFTGRVFQVKNVVEDKYLLLVTVAGEPGSFGNDDVRVDYSGPRILDDDIVEFVGSVEGLWTYTKVLGSKRTIPYIRAIRLVVPAIEATASPTTIPVQEPAGMAAPTPTATPPTTPTPTPQPINLSGRGQQASSKFNLLQGLAIFKITHDGQGHFGIWLLDSQGRNVDLLVNESGPFDGSKAVRIETSGTYLLDVSADGNWQVTIEQ